MNKKIISLIVIGLFTSSITVTVLINDEKFVCEVTGGHWKEGFNVCMNMSKEQCDFLEGKFNECDNLCMYQIAEIVIECPDVCVPSCKFN